MRTETLILILAFIAIAYFIWQMFIKKPEIRVVDANAQNQKDINDAMDANADVICITTIATGISPYNGEHKTLSPCVLTWLVNNRGWKELDMTTVAQYIV